MSIRSTIQKWARGLLAAGFLCGLAAAPASALTLDIVVEDEFGGLIEQLDMATLGSAVNVLQNPGKSSLTSFEITTAYEGSGWKLNGWNSTVDYTSLFISDNFSVTNNTGATKSFSFYVTSAIPNLLVDRIIYSTVDVTLTDTDAASRALLQTDSPDPVYDAEINGATALTFLDDPFSLSCSNPVDCLINGRAADGVVSESITPINANEIGILVKFSLSPGDSADVLSRFQVIPEPGTGFLVASGLAGLALARRQRMIG